MNSESFSYIYKGNDHVDKKEKSTARQKEVFKKG